MKPVAFIFPGQGTQFAGMGKELANSSERARMVFAEADRALGWEISRLCFEGPDELLGITSNTQPAVLTVCVALYEAIREAGFLPSAVAGHSLGEYTALVACGALGFPDACRLVAKRGKLMEEAVPPGIGGMAAVIGMRREDVLLAVERARDAGVVEAVNFNCPDQVVISGENPALEKACELARSMGAKRTVRLGVSGPFHSSLMAEAAKKLAQELEKVKISSPEIPVVGNVTADYLGGPDEIAGELAHQVASPVLWEDSLRRLWDDGFRTFVEVGPSSVLSGLVRKTLPGAVAIACDVRKPLEINLEMLKGALVI